MTRRILLVVCALVAAAACSLGPVDTPSPPPAETPAPTETTDGPTPAASTPPVPRNGVRIEVGDDAQATVEAHPPGSRFVFASGVHRRQSVEPRDGDVFTGEPGAVLSGAALLDAASFRRDGDVWAATTDHTTGSPHGEMLPGHEREAHPVDLYVDGERWRHVGDRSDVDAAGEWFLDDAGELVVGADPSLAGTLELAVTEAAFSGAGVRDVTIENLVVRHYASPSQRGAIDGRHSVGWTVRFVDASWNHAYGLGTGPGMLVEHSRFSHNGQAGVGGPGARHSDSPVAPGEVRPLRVSSNEISSNRELGYRWRWEGGGTKFTLTSHMVFSNNHVLDNGGPGLWWDIDNEDPIGCANLVQGNVIGIFPEIGQGAIVAWNEVHGNLRAGEEDASTGIFVSNTSDVEIRQNAVSGQPLGILVRAADDGDRDHGDWGPRRSTGLHVHDNTVAFDDHSGVRIETDDPEERATATFESNHWLVPDPAGRHWVFGSDEELLTWSEWQELGMDADGRVSETDGTVRPALPDDVPAFTPTHYGPLAAGEEPPSAPAAADCAAALD